MPRKTTKAAVASKYENNPFFVAANGITLLFNLSVGIAVLMVVLSILSFIGNNFKPGDSIGSSWIDNMNAWSGSQWALAIVAGLIIGLALAMVYALFGGVSSYASYKLSRGERVSVGGAFHEAFDKLWSYLWLQILIVGKIILWSLPLLILGAIGVIMYTQAGGVLIGENKWSQLPLLFIPGFLRAFRYTLAGVAFFDEDKHLRGNDAIKESLRLTKGAWITTFASNMLFNFLTFGFFSPVITTAVNAVLYKQFTELKDKPKPAAHWLSWATLAIPFVLFVFGFVLLIGVVIGLAVGVGSH